MILHPIFGANGRLLPKMIPSYFCLARFRKSGTDHESSRPQLDEEHFPLRLDAAKKHLFTAKHIDMHLVIDGLFEFARASNSMTDAGV
jgi:hypothetical protein